MKTSFYVLAILLAGATGCGSGSTAPADTATTELTGQQKLEATLEDSGLTLCEAYAWIEKMEADTRHQIEARTEMNVVDREQHLEEMRDKAWTDYRTFANLPDSVRVQINGYGITACP